MPPKKGAKDAAEVDNTILLGRFKSTLKCGLVGLPNVGKSTFFTLITKAQAEAANYPFCTVEPNSARAPVPDARFDELVAAHKPKSSVPAFFQLWDIAGLVAGAAEGAGLGNKFLSHIQAVDGIMHMVRVFADDDVTHVEGAVDPVRDLAMIHAELRVKDLQFVRNRYESYTPAKRTSDKVIRAECEALERFRVYLESGKQIRHGTWSNEEVELLNELLLLSSKPAMYLLNLSAKDYCRKKNKWLVKIKQWLDANCPGDPIVPLSCAFETELGSLPAVTAAAAAAAEPGGGGAGGAAAAAAAADATAAREAFSAAHDGAKSVLPKVITTGYHHLRLIHFFTAGPDEVKCWTVREGTKAPQAAGTIHTDFEKGFIMAEVMAYADWKALGGEAGVRAAGKYRNEGKNYVVQDGDIIFFRFNAAKGGKKR